MKHEANRARFDNLSPQKPPPPPQDTSSGIVRYLQFEIILQHGTVVASRALSGGEHIVLVVHYYCDDVSIR